MLFAVIKIGFLEISIGDILDILLVGLLFFQLYKILRGTLAFNIFLGVVVLYVAWWVVSLLEMKMLSSILGQFMQSGFIMLVIVFQAEIRRFLFYIGRGSSFGIGKERIWERLLNRNQHAKEQKIQLRNEIIKALTQMASVKTGALLVITDSSERNFFANTGVTIDGQVSAKLIESVFDKGSPLHDGAMVISDYKIWAAGCVLPVSENPDLPKRIGMRHRAAVGITEQIDVDVIIVSEETGKISHAKKGQLTLGLNATNLLSLLDTIFEIA